MSLEEIEQAIKHLSPSEFREFRGWFDDFDASTWDRQFEQDATKGSLDKIADQIVNDFYAGKCREM